jgi:SAM-dependent methyltransferase
VLGKVILKGGGCSSLIGSSATSSSSNLCAPLWASWRPAGLMGELARWHQSVEEFVLDQVGPLPARVLEVGCGEGQLAQALAEAGHSVTAIDPQAPEGPIFQRVKLEEFSDPAPFDYVVASLSLHHIEELGRALDKVADSLRAGGAVIVVEFAWDRIDEATARWVLEHLPGGSASWSEGPSWLQHLCRGWAHPIGGEGQLPAASYVAEWASENRIHTYRRMRAELGRRFEERLFEWVPYFYPDLDEDTSETEESAAIEAGVINATGFFYVGTTR